MTETYADRVHNRRMEIYEALMTPENFEAWSVKYNAPMYTMLEVKVQPAVEE